MGLAFTTTLAFCLWVIMWALGVKGFDGFLITIVIVLVAATIKSLTKFLPGARRPSGSGGW